MELAILLPMEFLNPSPTDELGHIVLLIATGDCETIYVDNVGFSSTTNGDIKYAAKLPDNQGEYVSMPFTFESATREGWVTEGLFSADGRFPYVDEVPLRNLVLVFASAESDYNGYIYCDNVEFTE